MNQCELAFVSEFRSIFLCEIIVAHVFCSEAIGDGDVDGYQRLPWLLRVLYFNCKAYFWRKGLVLNFQKKVSILFSW